MSVRPWTEAHVAEGHRALCREAGELPPGDAQWMLGDRRASSSAKRLRDALTSVGKPSKDRDRRVARVMRRVRALADSPPRLVRVTTWRGQSGEEYASRADAVADKSHGGCRLTRITRFRRATP